MNKENTYKRSYFGNIRKAVSSVMGGFKLTFRHFIKGYSRRSPFAVSDDNYFVKQNGLVTIQYPREQMPVPENGRYRLYNETPDCIACDKCARICPVDCITIESFKAVEDLGYTSDGTKKRLWLPTFDIDLGKCCYCGLCTTVCPTECLTMTRVYDYSEFDRDNFVYHFGNLSPEETVQKKKDLENFESVKKAAKDAAAKEMKKPDAD